MSTMNTQSVLSPEAEAYIAQAKEAFVNSPDGYELPADAGVEEVNMYYQNVAVYAKTQATSACEKNGYVDTRIGAYADMQAADEDRESFDKRGKAFQFNNQYKDLGDRDKLQSDYDNAVANGQTEMAEALSSSLEAIDAADKDISNRKASAQTKYDNAGYGIDARDTEIAFWDAWLKGDTEATNNAFSAYKDADNKNFEVNIMPEMASGIQSQADAEAYNKACEAHGIKIQNDSPETGSAVEAGENKSIESQTAEVTTTDYSAQPASDKIQTVTDSSPDPYAGFEKPECPPGMPGSAYTQMCTEAEKSYRNSINEKRAAEIMSSGDYKNNNDYLNQLVEDGYDVSAVQSIMDEKSKAQEQTAEVAESSAASAEKNEKPNPYVFEKPERPENMSDKDYDDMCKLAEAEHIDKVNHDFAAEINAGKYGNGHDARRAAIEAQGGDYEAVRAVINNEYVPMYEAEQAKQAAEAKAAEPTVSEAEMLAATKKISIDGIQDIAESDYANADKQRDAIDSTEVAGATFGTASNTKEGASFGEDRGLNSPINPDTVKENAYVGDKKKTVQRTLVPCDKSTVQTMQRTEAKPVETKPAETGQPAASSSGEKGYYEQLAENAYFKDQPKTNAFVNTGTVLSGNDAAYFKDQKTFDPTIDIQSSPYLANQPEVAATIDTKGMPNPYVNADRFNSGTHIADNIKYKNNAEISYDND